MCSLSLPPEAPLLCTRLYLRVLLNRQLLAVSCLPYGYACCYLLKWYLSVADLMGCEGRPPGGPYSFKSMQFLGKFGKIVCWRSPPGELAPPPWGNPGSATACGFAVSTVMLWVVLYLSLVPFCVLTYLGLQYYV